VLTSLTKGDTLVVWKLDRLGRSVVDLANIVVELKQRGVGIRSLTDGIDTSTGGIAADLTLNVLAAVAQFERDLIRERVTNGLAAAAKEGRKGGRRFKLTDDDLDLLLDLWDRGVPVTSLAAKWGVDQATIYRSYKRALARRERGASNGQR
jgi:DNA invertase Pin-like site-specific DNA recombinase